MADSTINVNRIASTFLHKVHSSKSDDTKQMALSRYVKSLGFCAIGKLLDVSHQTAYRWIR